MKFIHLADVHLGMENYGRLDPDTGLHTRLEDYIRCYSHAIDTAKKEDVDLVIFSGDAFKNSNPNPTHQREFAKQIYRLSEANIPVVLISGNHDNPVSYGKATSMDIFGILNVPGVTVINEPSMVMIDTKSGPVQVFGLPWPTKNLFLTKEECRDITDGEIVQQIQIRGSQKILEFAGMAKPGIPTILAAHLAVAEATYSGSERSVLIGSDPVFPAQILTQEAFNYVALGHVHKYQDLNPGNNCPVVYSGSIERINFGEEKEDKGYCLVEIKDGNTSYKFIEVPARRFLTIDVTITKDQDPTAVLLSEIGKHDLAGVIVRIFFTLPVEGAVSPIDFRQINTALEDAFMVATISEKTKPIERTKRAEISENIGMLEALGKYIESNPDLVPFAEELKAKALNLEQELENAGKEVEVI